MNTTILPTPPTSGAIVTGGYDNGYGLSELITNNNIAETSREILAALGTGNASIIANAGVHSVAALNATNLASVSNLKATGDASVAGIKTTTDGITSVNKNVYDGVVSSLNATSLSAVATQKAISDSALANALTAGETRELINTTAYATALGLKDNGFAIREEGCKTREEVIKGNAVLALQACKDNAELAKQIAEICCCVERDGNITRSLVLAENTKRLESELQEARLKAAICGLGRCSTGNGNNGNNGNS